MERRTRRLQRPDLVPVRTLSVKVIEGPDRGAIKVTGDERLTAGTAKGNDLVLRDATVSRFHLELTRIDDRIHVTDLGSTNGTMADAIAIERGFVPAGSTLRIGDTLLKVGNGRNSLVAMHQSNALGELRGDSAIMRRLMARVVKAAESDVATLLIGESGTGKELIARALHAYSARAQGPFITVDCGALTPTLVASELFGHERGAFTGADDRRLGAFERANGGTIFLDEIGELPLELQSNMLGALERRQIRRVGGQQDIDIDVRLIAATHRDMRSEVNAGRFRLDLYYRLAVLTLSVPPLRERPDDVRMLVAHFVEESGYPGALAELFGEDTMVALEAHRWPGNVRELRNLVEAAVAMGEAILPQGLGGGASAAAAGRKKADARIPDVVELPYREARSAVVRAFEGQYLKRLLERADGNVSEAARLADMNRSHLSDLLKRHGLR